MGNVQDHKWIQCQGYIDGQPCICDKLEEDLVRIERPELFTMELHELRSEMYKAMYQFEQALRAMKIRGIKDFWNFDKMIDDLRDIGEEYGWEGVGR